MPLTDSKVTLAESTPNTSTTLNTTTSSLLLVGVSTLTALSTGSVATLGARTGVNTAGSELFWVVLTTTWALKVHATGVFLL